MERRGLSYRSRYSLRTTQASGTRKRAASPERCLIGSSSRWKGSSRTRHEQNARMRPKSTLFKVNIRRPEPKPQKGFTSLGAAQSMAGPRKVIILGAAGRDFHNFNVYFRDNPAYEVVAFTATQIPGIATRKYPASLAGKLYPDGIPIFPEEELPSLIKKFDAQTCVFSYSDVDYAYVGHRIALANSHGAEFLLLGAQETMLKAKVPVVAVCAVRTGSGKSQTSRRVAGILRAHGKKVVVEGASPITPDDSVQIRGKKVLAIEDGPTLTHGGMEYGAAYIAAQRFGAAEIVSAVNYAVGSIKDTYKKYPNSRKILPAMGYGPKQIKELEETIDATPCDLVLSGTPIDLSRVLKTKKPVVHVRYELDEIGHPNLEDVLRDWELI